MPRQKLVTPENQSAECRRYYDAHPDASPKECVAGLKKEGLKVSEHTASNAKYRRPAKPAKVAVPAVRVSSMDDLIPEEPAADTNGNGEFKVSDLMALKQFAQAHGGLDNLGAMATALKQVQLG